MIICFKSILIKLKCEAHRLWSVFIATRQYARLVSMSSNKIYNDEDECVKKFLVIINLRCLLNTERVLNTFCNLTAYVCIYFHGSHLCEALSKISLLKMFILLSKVSFFSTSPELSNKQRFEYFSRTIPSDHYQVKAMVEIVVRLGWSYISVSQTFYSVTLPCDLLFHKHLLKISCRSFMRRVIMA